jgi:hypothetical protein
VSPFSFESLVNYNYKSGVIAAITEVYTCLKGPVVTICITCVNTLNLPILPTECIYVFRMVLTINSDCFPKQH